MRRLLLRFAHWWWMQLKDEGESGKPGPRPKFRTMKEKWNWMPYWRASLTNRPPPNWYVMELELGYRAAFALYHHDDILFDKEQA